MKAFKDLTSAELVTKLKEEEEKIRGFKFAEGITRTKNVKEGRAAKKLIAQLKTELAHRIDK